jgi:hypothetical protein
LCIPEPPRQLLLLLFASPTSPATNETRLELFFFLPTINQVRSQSVSPAVYHVFFEPCLIVLVRTETISSWAFPCVRIIWRECPCVSRTSEKNAHETLSKPTSFNL